MSASQRVPLYLLLVVVAFGGCGEVKPLGACLAACEDQGQCANGEVCGRLEAGGATVCHHPCDPRSAMQDCAGECVPIASGAGFCDECGRPTTTGPASTSAGPASTSGNDTSCEPATPCQSEAQCPEGWSCGPLQVGGADFCHLPCDLTGGDHPCVGGACVPVDGATVPYGYCELPC